jgi:galactokinase/galacturonokinase
MTHPPIHTAQPESKRIERLISRLRTMAAGAAARARIVRVPLRISPLGAHIDHQLGTVLGMAVDRAILLAFAPTSDGSVFVESLDFDTPTRFPVDSVPPYQRGDWGNYLRGAALALQQEQPLTHGIVGVIDGDMPIGGLSSSAAVTIAYLLALESANGLERSPHENIALVTRTEHEYIGLNNGILDQTSILFSRRNHLTRIDCQTVQIEPIPTAAPQGSFEIMAVYSGVDRALVGTSYNNRVAECQAAASQLLAHAGQQNGDSPRLREVDPALFAVYGPQLPEPLRRRATHFFTEMERVSAGEAAWREGDMVRFGELVSASGASSIDNYECGCPQLITLYQILRETPGVFGVRFSGAGFRGNCLALIDPAQRQLIAEHLHQHYPSAHPEMADRYSIHFCQPDDGARLLV